MDHRLYFPHTPMARQAVSSMSPWSLLALYEIFGLRSSLYQWGHPLSRWLAYLLSLVDLLLRVAMSSWSWDVCVLLVVERCLDKSCLVVYFCRREEMASLLSLCGGIMHSGRDFSRTLFSKKWPHNNKMTSLTLIWRSLLMESQEVIK